MKNQLTGLLICSVFGAGSILATSPAASAIPVPVDSYNFTGSNLMDGGTNGNNLTAGGADAASVSYSSNVPAGFTGQSVSLDGANFLYSANTNSVSGSFTLDLWVNLSTSVASTGGAHTFFGTRGPNDASFDAKLGNLGGSSTVSGIHGDIGTGVTNGSWLTTAADDPYTYNTGTWYNIAYEVTPTGYTIYANGNSVGSGSYGTNTPLLYDVNHTITIGDAANTGGNAGEYFKGLIYDVNIYNSALSQSDIRTLVPEPGSLALCLLGLPAIVARRRRSRA